MYAHTESNTPVDVNDGGSSYEYDDNMEAPLNDTNSGIDYLSFQNFA